MVRQVFMQFSSAAFDAFMTLIGLEEGLKK